MPQKEQAKSFFFVGNLLFLVNLSNMDFSLSVVCRVLSFILGGGLGDNDI